MDNFRVSSVARYMGSYTVPNTMFQYEPQTVCINNFDNLAPGYTGDATTVLARTNECPVISSSQLPSGLPLARCERLQHYLQCHGVAHQHLGHIGTVDGLQQPSGILAVVPATHPMRPLPVRLAVSA